MKNSINQYQCALEVLPKTPAMAQEWVEALAHTAAHHPNAFGQMTSETLREVEDYFFKAWRSVDRMR